MRLIKLFEEWCADVYESNREWLPFEEAREYIRSLGLKTQREWNKWVGSSERPPNIPTTPHITYKNKGWIGYGDWLGTGNTSTQNREFLPFEEAREYVRSLGLKSIFQWIEWAKSSERPKNIPTVPDKIYNNKGWIGYGDWLGTGNIATRNREFLPFEEAREYVRSLGLKSVSQWQEWLNSGETPENIPTNPYKIYKDEGWISYGDWLGTGRVREKDFLPFEEAREYVRSLGLKDTFQWRDWAKSSERPQNIPVNPNIAYQDNGWMGYGDWLGTGRVREKEFLPFEEAKRYAQSLGFKTAFQWREWVKSSDKPQNIPAAPEVTYKDKGWIDWYDWLGTNKTETVDYVSYDLAKEMIQPLEIKSPEQWIEYYKMNRIPKTIPQNPSVVYADKGWLGWGDFLGSEITLPQYA
jgi:hypothetical protein